MIPTMVFIEKFIVSDFKAPYTGSCAARRQGRAGERGVTGPAEWLPDRPAGAGRGGLLKKQARGLRGAARAFCGDQGDHSTQVEQGRRRAGRI